MSRPMLKTLGLTAALSLMLTGCGTRAKQQTAKREQDRTVMQIEDLTNQRNVFKAELDRARTANAELSTALEARNKQLEQMQRNLAEANSVAAKSRQDVDAVRAQLDTMQKRLEQLDAELKSHAAPAAGGETRELRTPATQPSGPNK